MMIPSEGGRSTMERHVSRVPHLPIEPNPALVEHARQRAESVQNRIADQITTFAGSMVFVYIHLLWFGCWIGFRVEGYPYGLLTMIVSLEAIFLSCFVLISQNRQAEKDRVRSNIEYEVNIKAELEVAHLHEKTDRIHAEMLEHFIRIEKTLAARNSAAA
jgi:uncharacterized membrane protein